MEHSLSKQHTHLTTYFQIICKNLMSDKCNILNNEERKKFLEKYKKKCIQIFFSFLLDEHLKCKEIFGPKRTLDVKKLKQQNFTFDNLQKQTIANTF